MTKVAFLLGAGASYPFGIPMMRQFYDRFVTFIHSRRAHCSELLNQITVGCETSPDLELLIRNLEEVRSLRSGLQTLRRLDADLSAKLELADELRGYLDSFLIETCERFDAERVTEKLGRLVRFAHKHDAHVFTTNYDRLVEFAAAGVSVPVTDGFDSSTTRPESSWTGIFSGGLRLIKLHGSVNWYEEEETGDIFRLERGYSMPSHEFRLSHGKRLLKPLMIIPTLEKAVMKQPYAGLMTQFSDALKDVSIFIVVGNSLRDEHLQNTVTQRAEHYQTIIVNPAAASMSNVSHRPTSTHAVPLGIEQFLEFGLPPLETLLEDWGRLLPGDSTRQHAQLADYAAQMASIASSQVGMTDSDRVTFEDLQGDDVRIVRTLTSISGPLHPALLERIQQLAVGSSGEAVRTAAIDSLVDTRSPGAIPVLESIAISPNPMLVRAEAILALQALSEFDTTNAIQRVGEAVKLDPALAGFVETA